MARPGGRRRRGARSRFTDVGQRGPGGTHSRPSRCRGRWAPVQVPAGIGIDPVHRAISPLHTHDTSGVIHIESPVQRQFSLGEFFSEWGVSLSADNIGGLRATDGNSVRVFVNGAPRSGNPAAIMFNQHDEIALLYGTPK